jgi:dipeptidyl aminopeptidase/acylaminoacyl peptidase
LYNRAVRAGSIVALLLLQAAAAPPDTEIFLASLSTSDGGVKISAPFNISNNPGYDNQPSFTPDGRSVLFTSIRGGAQTDIYRYDIPAGKLARVTDTPESEYSPTVTPDGAHISVIRVEADGTQRLWRFTIDGAQPELVLTDVKPVGYHAWVDDHTLALFVLGQPGGTASRFPTLQIADTRTGKAESFVPGINRSIQRIPGGRTISFVQRVSSSQQDVAPTLKISELNPTSRRVTPLVNAVAGAREADCAWTPDGMLLMADKDVLYGWRRGENDWRRLADLAALGLHGVSRLAVSPGGDRIALVTQAQP